MKYRKIGESTNAWSGCDATSTTLDQGKTVSMKLITKENREVLDICSTIDQVDARSNWKGQR